MTPKLTGNSQRDDAVALLELIVAMATGETNLIRLYPDIQARIAEFVDAIISAAKPGGGPHQEDTGAKSAHSLVDAIEHRVAGAVEAVEHAVEDILPHGERRRRLGDRRQKLINIVSPPDACEYFRWVAAALKASASFQANLSSNPTYRENRRAGKTNEIPSAAFDPEL
jgi:hypothetical protein